MPHVSKKKLKSDALLSLHKRFTDSFVRLNTTDQVSQFLDELLTDTERLMIGKRLAIICMLSEGISTYRIEQTLRVSISTVIDMKRKYQDCQYDFIESLYKQKKNHKDFWKDIDTILRLGMPPMGRGRWKWLYELENKYK